MNLELKTYRTILKEELAQRCSRNARYSLRSFAKFLNISPGRLSDVMNGRYGLSRNSAQEIASRLGYNTEELNHFCDLVDSQHARAKKEREKAKERLKTNIPEKQNLTMDAFQIVSDWYHYAILELTVTKNFKSSPKWISKKLDVSEHIVKSGIERMKRLGLIEEASGSLKAVDDFSASPSGIPSESIKKFHTQVLEKALAAIREQSLDERDFSSIIMAINPKDIPDAKEEIKNFRRKLNNRFEKSKTKSSVYCLNIQLFRLSND